MATDAAIMTLSRRMAASRRARIQTPEIRRHGRNLLGM
jgi:hypothetical protein